MVLNSTKLPWMRDDRVILSLTIGAHNGDDIIEAWTHQAWSKRHAKKVRVGWDYQRKEHFSTSKWDLFLGFENTYNIRVRPHTTFIPIPEEKRNMIVLPDLQLHDLMDRPDSHHDFIQGSISDSLHKIHTIDRKAFNIQRSKNMLRQILDICGFSCFRYRYNYHSNKIAESMELAQYVDTSILVSGEPAHNPRLNHRFFIIDAVPHHLPIDEMKARVIGKALVTAMMKYMAGVSRTSEIEIFILVLRGSKVRIMRIVFEPDYLGDISRGLVPEHSTVMWEEESEHGHGGELELLKSHDRNELVRKLEHIRLSMHVRI